MLNVIFILITLATCSLARDLNISRQYVDVPDIVFNDSSALKNKSNLQSKQYQDFIHTLYRFDRDNLQKVDQLFGNTGGNSQADYTVANYYGRGKRAIMFRPLFVYVQQTVKRKRIPEKYQGDTNKYRQQNPNQAFNIINPN